MTKKNVEKLEINMIVEDMNLRNSISPISIEIVKIDKLEYRTIIKYLYLMQLRGKQINKDMLNAFGDQF